MKNFVACTKCKVAYRYSTTTSSDKIKKHECYVEISKKQNTTNSSSFPVTSNVKLTQSTLSNHSFKCMTNHESDKNIKSTCSDLIVDWISNNIRPLSIVEDKGLHELLQFFYALGELFF
jgi:hypothetical protein